MATPFLVELVTPERVLLSGEAEEVSLRTDAGEIAFLANHEDFVGAVDITLCSVHLADQTEDEGSPLKVAVHGGFVYVAGNTVTILASVAELGGEIDVERAREALAAAEQQLAMETTGEHSEEEQEVLAGAPSSTMLALLAPDSAEAAARRARTRLEAAGASPAA
jgi:F-type H+-transporting ATPase subunit epsilon